jgi:putative DNA methylase
VFFVARKRLLDQVGSYEDTVRPALEQIARERVDRLWAGGRGLGGADLLMAAVGAGLRPFTEFSRVEYANGETVSPERFIFEVEGVVLDTILERVFGLSRASVSMVDKLTRFYVLWRFTYKESEIESGDAIVFCYPQGIEIDGPSGVSGPAPALVEKDGSTYRVRTFEERGESEDLGANDGGVSAPLIDSLHRLLWLMTYSPTKVPTFLQSAKPNLEQIRLVAQALSGPVLTAVQGKDAELTAELSALSKLTANWKSVIEGSGAPEEDLLSGTTGVHIG